MRWLILWLGVVPMFAADIRRIDPPAAAESGMPFLASSPHGKLYLSWTDMLGGKDHAFRFSRWSGKQWTAPETIATGNNWFVNWADFPSIAAMDDGSMLAHWLTRADDGGKFGYGIRIAKRSAGEARWTEIHGMSLDEKTDYAGFLSFIPGGGKPYFSRRHRSLIRIIKRLRKRSTSTKTIAKRFDLFRFKPTAKWSPISK